MADSRDLEIAELRRALGEALEDASRSRHDLANVRAEVEALRRWATRRGIELPGHGG